MGDLASPCPHAQVSISGPHPMRKGHHYPLPKDLPTLVPGDPGAIKVSSRPPGGLQEARCFSLGLFPSL